MSDNTSDDEKNRTFNRRSVLKTLGAGAAASAFPMTGVASAQQSAPEGGVEITGTTGVSPDAVEEDIQAVTEQSETRSLTSRIRGETGFQLDTEFAVGIDLETDDKEVNKQHPRVMHLPLKPTSAVGISGAKSTEGTLSSESDSDSDSEYSIDNGGALLALTVLENGERKLAALMGITREKIQNRLLSTKSGETVTTKSFVVEDGSAKVHRKNTGQETLKESWQAELGKTDPTFTTADSGFTCWGCATVVGLACAGAATLSYSTCVSAAFASSAFSPAAGATVAAFCTYIVANAGTLSCAAGTAAICAGVTNDCQFLEDEL